MSKRLHISGELSLPIDAATQTFAFIARKGAGKTYAAGKLVELLLDADVQCVILDTVGNWYGLRIAADGKGDGFDVPVVGGLRGDVPLEATGGELIADIVADTGRSLVLDISQFSLADRKRFAVTFGERLWKRKKGEHHPSPLHLVIEESLLIIPQFTGMGGDSARMVGIYEEIIRLGRNYGIGVTMISQRPQSVNKEVLNQTECLFVGQVNGAQERDALKKWITHQGMDVKLVDELPALPIGVFYVWSPQWLQILKKVKIEPKKTFDASSTPKVGESRARRDPKPLDLEDLKQKLAATIERAKAEDPRELRKTIAELRRQLQQVQASKPEKKVEVPVVTDAQVKRVESIVTRLETEGQKRIAAADQLAQSGRELKNTAGEFMAALSKASGPARVNPPIRPAIAPRRVQASAPSDERVGKAERAILTALAQLGPTEKRRLGVRSGYAHTGGGFNNALGRCRSMGWVERGEPITITQQGADALGPVDPLPVGAALIEHWNQQLGRAEREILRVAADASGRVLTKEEVAAQTTSDTGEPYNAAGGGFNNAVGRLRALGILEGKGGIKISEEFLA